MYGRNLAVILRIPNFALIALSMMMPGASAIADQSFTVNGESVPKNVYEAAVLAQEANAFLATGNLDRAERKLKMALRCDPKFLPAHGNLAIILARQGKNAEALLHFKKSVEYGDSSPSAYLNLASFYQTTGNLDAAIDTFKSFLEKSSSSSDLKVYAENTLKMLEREREQRQKNGAAEGKGSRGADYFADATATSSLAARWTEFRMPLKVYIEPSPDAEGYDPRYEKLLREAFVDWEHAAGRKISFLFVPARELCDIDCSWTNDADKLGNGTEYGNTTINARAGVLSHAQIVLRSKEEKGGFPFNDNTVLTTCRHEVGHALGISWHSVNPSDVMYFSIPMADREQKITTRDKNTMMKLYASDIAWTAKCVDFMSAPSTLKNSGPIITVLAMLLAFLLLVARLFTKTRKRR